MSAGDPRRRFGAALAIALFCTRIVVARLAPGERS